MKKIVELLQGGGVEGAERSLLATTEDGFCESYAIKLATLALIRTLAVLAFPYHLALKCTDISFFPFFFFFFFEIFFVLKNLKGERQFLSNALWRKLNTLFSYLSIC